MKFWFAVFRSSLSQRLRDVKSWLVVLLLPLLILGLGSRQESRMSTPITVGVVLPETGAAELRELLTARGGELLTFVETDAGTIDRNVASGQWDCGLVFAEDFREKLEEQDLDGAITVRISGGSAVYPLVQESVCACLAQLTTAPVAREYLLEKQIVGSEDISVLEPRLQEIYERSNQVGVVLTSADGAPLVVPELAERGVQQILCWLISAVLLVTLVFGAVDLGTWCGSPAVGRMQPLRSVLSMLTAKACAEGTLTALSGCAAMLLLPAGGRGCLAVAGYCLFWLSVSVLLARLPRIHPILPVCLPFLVAVSFLASSVLVDISLVLPGAGGVLRWLPASLFLRTCAGEGSAFAALLAGAAVCLALSAVVLRGGRRSEHTPV